VIMYVNVATARKLVKHWPFVALWLRQANARMLVVA